MSFEETTVRRTQLPLLSAGFTLAAAVITACPSTPTPYAPWVWGTAVVVVLVITLLGVAKQPKPRLALP
ncbi:MULTISPECIES: hypothetical protein [Streptomyces]|uniref:hypothetical protein n=1 Tax=Streptomyces TaxID=1883 RepID=UPI0018F78DA8|nr:hypothetical protein [Streptomyces murinus]